MLTVITVLLLLLEWEIIATDFCVLYKQQSSQRLQLNMDMLQMAFP